MDKKCEKLLRKMCLVLNILKGIALIWFIITILLAVFMFFVDINSIPLDSLRIDIIDLTLKNDLFINKEMIAKILPVGLLLLGMLFFVGYKMIKIVESICKTALEKPFDISIANYLVRLSKYILVGGLITNLIIIFRFIILTKPYNYNLLFNENYVSDIQFKYQFNLTFLIDAALVYLLSYVFRYGKELQDLSDETL